MKKNLLLLLIVAFSKLQGQNCANPPIVNAGPDMAICNDHPVIPLNGSINQALSIVWSTDGTGVFSDQKSVMSTYLPSDSDLAKGSVNLVLTAVANGNCPASSDVIMITFTPGPVVSAGQDITTCADTVSLVGLVNGAVGGIWSTSGSGTFKPNTSSLNPTYTFSEEDKKIGRVIFSLESTGNGKCLPAKDNMVVTMFGMVTFAPPEKFIFDCDTVIMLTANISNGGRVEWRGKGTFIPNRKENNVRYKLTPEEIAQKSAKVFVNSVGSCSVYDSVLISIPSKPIVNAGPDITTGEQKVDLKGSVLHTFGVKWTTSGGGKFSPDENSLDASYNLSEQDKASGIVKLVLTLTNNGSCPPASDTAIIYFTRTSSIKSEHSNSLLSIFPVPAQDFVTISLPHGTAVNATILDGSGKLMMERQLVSGENIIDVKDLPNGMYIIKMFSGDNFYLGQFTKN
ncbi:MAG TPA: T9SS type A sorting domain-containing protein [Cytophagaceae bacterium]|jgi:hypothetical protein